jgi:hypothetical protein
MDECPADVDDGNGQMSGSAKSGGTRRTDAQRGRERIPQAARDQVRECASSTVLDTVARPGRLARSYTVVVASGLAGQAAGSAIAAASGQWSALFLAEGAASAQGPPRAAIKGFLQEFHKRLVLV